MRGAPDKSSLSLEDRAGFLVLIHLASSLLPAPTRGVVLYLFRFTQLHSARLEAAVCDFWVLESGHSPLTHQSPQCVHRAPLNVVSGLHG